MKSTWQPVRGTLPKGTPEVQWPVVRKIQGGWITLRVYYDGNFRYSINGAKFASGYATQAAAKAQAEFSAREIFAEALAELAGDR